MDKQLSFRSQVNLLAERTQNFARDVRKFSSKIPRTISSIEDMKQLVRAAGSVGANYLEADEALSKKDFIMRLKICRKEARETAYWLQLLSPHLITEQKLEHKRLINESKELLYIFQASIAKATKNLSKQLA